MSDQPHHFSVAAVVVTYNRSELLKRALEAISNQTRLPDHLYVIDNCSTDITPTVLSDFEKLSQVPITSIRLNTNIGGAGGFHKGAVLAYESGYDAIWFMDDDTIAQPRALEALICDLEAFENKTGYAPAFICSTVLWKNDEICEMNIPKPIWDWPRFLNSAPQLALVESCSFVSVLVRRTKIREAGYPIPDFFIWYDDVEFTSRLSRHGYPGLLSLNSRVNHLLPENVGVNFRLMNDKTAWKFFYAIRNEAAVILRDQGTAKFLLHAMGRLRLVLSLDVSMKKKIRLVQSLISAVHFSKKCTPSIPVS